MKSIVSAIALVALVFACSNTTKVAEGTTPAPTTSVPASGTTVDAGRDTGAAKVPGVAFKCVPAAAAGEFYALGAKDIADDETSMCEYRGKVVLVVNVASKCGNTPQYVPLEKMYTANKSKGLVILGFPCNQFGAQESGSNEEINGFCRNTYGVDFPMFAKTDVNGPTADPIYKWLKAQPGGAGEVDWNFAKFLIGRDGKLIKRFASSVLPDSKEITDAVAAALAAP